MLTSMNEFLVVSRKRKRRANERGAPTKTMEEWNVQFNQLLSDSQTKGECKYMLNHKAEMGWIIDMLRYILTVDQMNDVEIVIFHSTWNLWTWMQKNLFENFRTISGKLSISIWNLPYVHVQCGTLVQKSLYLRSVFDPYTYNIWTPSVATESDAQQLQSSSKRNATHDNHMRRIPRQKGHLHIHTISHFHT